MKEENMIVRGKMVPLWNLEGGAIYRVRNGPTAKTYHHQIRQLKMWRRSEKERI